MDPLGASPLATLARGLMPAGVEAEQVMAYERLRDAEDAAGMAAADKSRA